MKDQPTDAAKSDDRPVLAHISEDGRRHLLEDHLKGTADRPLRSPDSSGVRNGGEWWDYGNRGKI